FIRFLWQYSHSLIPPLWCPVCSPQKPSMSAMRSPTRVMNRSESPVLPPTYSTSPSTFADEADVDLRLCRRVPSDRGPYSGMPGQSTPKASISVSMTADWSPKFSTTFGLPPDRKSRQKLTSPRYTSFHIRAFLL